jgi:hypothetical protein
MIDTEEAKSELCTELRTAVIAAVHAQSVSPDSALACLLLTAQKMIADVKDDEIREAYVHNVVDTFGMGVAFLRGDPEASAAFEAETATRQ